VGKFARAQKIEWNRAAPAGPMRGSIVEAGHEVRFALKDRAGGF